MRWFKLLPLLLILCGLPACQDPSTSEPQTPLAAPRFESTDDPKQFFANYLKDLSGDRYLPPDLFKMLAERTRMSMTAPLFERHAPDALLEWYYADVYLEKHRELIDRKLKEMEYQLQVMAMPKELAGRILLVAEAGPIEHKRQLLSGGISETWTRYDATRYEVLLSNGAWQQLIGIGLENDRWKIRIFGAGS